MSICIGENQPCGTDEGFSCCGDEVECEIYWTKLVQECHWDPWSGEVCTDHEKEHGRCVNNCRGQHVICSDSSECCKGLTCTSKYPLLPTTCLEPAPTCAPPGGDCESMDCCDGWCQNMGRFWPEYRCNNWVAG